MLYAEEDADEKDLDSRKPEKRAPINPMIFEEGQDPIEFLHEDITSRYGEVVWAKMQGSPWWPGYVYDPRLTTGAVREGGYKDCTSKYTIYFFQEKT